MIRVWGADRVKGQDKGAGPSGELDVGIFEERYRPLVQKQDQRQSNHSKVLGDAMDTLFHLRIRQLVGCVSPSHTMANAGESPK